MPSNWWGEVFNLVEKDSKRHTLHEHLEYWLEETLDTGVPDWHIASWQDNNSSFRCVYYCNYYCIGAWLGSHALFLLHSRGFCAAVPTTRVVQLDLSPWRCHTNAQQIISRKFMQIRDLQQNTKLPKTSTCHFWGQIVAPPFGQTSANKHHQWTSSSTGGVWDPDLHALRFLQLGTHLAAPWMLQLGLSLGPPCLDFGKSCNGKVFHKS